MEGGNVRPSPELLRKLILHHFKQPVVFKSFLSEWECCSWTLQTWVEKFGQRILPFRSGVCAVTKIPQWERSCQQKNLSMMEFLQLEQNTANMQDENGVPRWLYFDYKYMNEWFDDTSDVFQVTSLEDFQKQLKSYHCLSRGYKAVSWKSFGFPERGAADSTIWIGTNGAHTPCHIDTYGCNLVAQVYGRKQWILFPPEKTGALSPTRIPYEESSVYSSINFYSPDLSVINNIQEAYVTLLEPGDVLFVPRHWWHYVENIGTAISINTWIPLPEDSESRLEEAVVKLLVSQICKGLPQHQQRILLNPNEEDLVECPLSVTLHQTQVCLKTCKEKQMESVNKHCGLQDETERWSHKEKRFKFDDSHASNDMFRTDESFGSLEDFFSKYNDYIRVVSRYSTTDLQDLFIMKHRSLPLQEYHEGGDFSSDRRNFEHDTESLKTIINAICDREVIAKVKEKMLV